MAGEKIFGMPRKYAIVGGAVAAGVVGYAWWRNGSTDTSAPVADTLEPSADEYESPLGNSGGNSTGSFPGNVDPDKIDTNSEWTQAAVEFLQGAGYDASAVVNALGKYLQFKALSATEAQIVMAARAAVGDPPVGGPYPIKDALPDPPSKPVIAKPGPITGLRSYGQNTVAIWLDWNDATNARGYDIENVGYGVKTSLTSSFTAFGLKKNTTYTFKVRARPETGGTTFGDWATIKVKTKAK